MPIPCSSRSWSLTTSDQPEPSPSSKAVPAPTAHDNILSAGNGFSFADCKRLWTPWLVSNSESKTHENGFDESVENSMSLKSGLDSLYLRCLDAAAAR
jgi:hypothetical protein|eukprot:COSAG02_NODE_1406_length_12786_cov_5.493418_18_plen_98_part_00